MSREPEDPLEESPSPIPASPARRVPEWLFLLVFPGLALFLLWEVLLGGKVLLPAEFLKVMAPWNAASPANIRELLPQWNVLQWDGMAEFYPWRLYAARSMTGGQIPLWNPYILSGTPFLANSQSAPLYPLHWLYYLPLGASVAVRLGWVDFLHLSLAGCFAYLLARDFRVRPLAALVAGAAFELSGFAVAWLELPSVIAVSCWIPLLLLCVGRAVREGSWRWTWGGAAALGMMLLAGHLQIAFYGLLAAGTFWVFGVGRLVLGAERGGRGKAVVGAVAQGLVLLGVGLALAAPQMLASLAFSRISHRAGAPSAAGYDGYVSLAMPLKHWITLLVPDYYGLPGRGFYWGLSWGSPTQNVVEYAGHVGLASVLLAVIGLLWGRKVTRRVWLPAAISVVALLLAFGTPLNRVFYFFVPGFSQTGSPARVLVLFCLMQALLAGMGAEWLLRRAEEAWKGVLLPVGGAFGATVLLLVGALTLAATPDPSLGQVDTVQPLVRAVAYAGVLAGLVLLLAWLLRDNPPAQRVGTVGTVSLVVVAGGLLHLGGAYNLTASPDLAYPETPLTTALRAAPGRVATLNRKWSMIEPPAALLPPNASIAYGWRDAQAYDSLLLGTARHLMDAVAQPEGSSSPDENGNMLFVKHVNSPLLPLLGARYIVSQQPLERPGLLAAADFPPGPPYVYEDRLALPEAYTVSDWFSGDEVAGLERLRSLGPTGLGSIAMVAPGGTLPLANPDTAGLSRAAPATIVRHSPQHLTVTTEAATPSLLVLLESFAPGWKARLITSGPPRTLPIVRANVAYQGVFIPAGKQTIEWRYEPASFRIGLFFGLLAAGVLLAVAVLGSRHRWPQMETDRHR